MSHLLELEVDPELSSKKIYVTTLSNIKNIAEVHKKIQSGEIDCCCLKPKLILDPLHIQVATNKSLLNEYHRDLQTKTFYTEIIYSLNPSKSISQSLQRFGISTADTEIMIVILSDTPKAVNDILKKFSGSVAEKPFPNRFVDEKAIEKLYQITEQELKVSSLVDSIVSRIATKEFMK